MSNKKVQKTIVIIMIVAMVASTVLFGLSTLF
ncbi:MULTISPECIES: stressosome-associated protein Prli42 [Sporosarcina]|uniref:Stressosome-associated protein Prli42 n=1 Tax=Sporosarcina gallistercoris TaxID=2762245 RepID=A0ABR8PF23_9BACL|nr:stressosome-associated protein Prli42 [Sporosarcina gallistercoris]MBD7906764.1 stressosome-associated protein Prli42 [Sporosarcina gallistercoris]